MVETGFFEGDIIMNKKEFVKIMKKLRVPIELYNIDGKGRDDERFCLVRDGEKWNVYYSERGRKTTNKFFGTESEALEYMCKELLE